MSERHPSHPIDESPTVLIVEDVIDLAELYATWLSERYTVQTVYTGTDALDSLDDSIDVVLLDRRMPGVSGDDVLTAIRERDLDCQVGIVSAVNPDFDVVESTFDEYLVKPVDEGELCDAVDRMLEPAGPDEAERESD